MSTLHIIGNGFDLCHGIESRYSDFKKYAFSHCNSRFMCEFVGILETCYPQKNAEGTELELWCDLENALGKPDLKAAYKESTEDLELDIDHFMTTSSAMEYTAVRSLQKMFESFRESFEKWVESVDIDVRKLDIPYFDENGKFLTFNYTETLETLYHIPGDRINYIHGRRNSGETLVLGHNKHVDARLQESENDMLHEYEAIETMGDIVNSQKKDTAGIIAANRSYWLSLGDTDKVIVYGHSLNDIDMPYFKEIVLHTDEAAKWYISVYGKNETDRAKAINHVEEFCDVLNIRKFQTFRLP